MTQEEFIKVLDEKDYPYEIEGDKLVVTSNVYYFDLRSLKSLPPGLASGNEAM